MYHPTLKPRAAQNCEERQQMLAQGWSEDPFPVAPAHAEPTAPEGSPPPAAATTTTEETPEPKDTPQIPSSITNRQKHPSKPQLPKRAAWLNEQLRKRGWNIYDLERQGGPEHRSAQKILDGLPVGPDVLRKVAIALSSKHSSVNVLHIPRD
jgi:hypothetical protein